MTSVNGCHVSACRLHSNHRVLIESACAKHLKNLLKHIWPVFFCQRASRFPSSPYSESLTSDKLEMCCFFFICVHGPGEKLWFIQVSWNWELLLCFFFYCPKLQTEDSCCVTAHGSMLKSKFVPQWCDFKRHHCLMQHRNVTTGWHYQTNDHRAQQQEMP